MRIFISLFFALSVTGLYSQSKTYKYSVSIHGGYGLENNYGNTVYFGGAALHKKISKKFSENFSITRFMISNSDLNRTVESAFDGEERFYKSWFFTPSVEYLAVGNNHSFFSFSLRTGPSLKFFNYKSLKFASVRVYADGTREP